MAVLNSAALSKSLRQNDLSPVYFLFGKETYQMEKCVSAIIKKAVGKNESCFNLRQLDGNRTDISSIIEAAEAYPVFSERKCVTVANLDLEKLSEKDYGLLKDLIKDPPQTTVLVFYYNALELNPKKSSKVKNFLGLVEKSGVAAEFSYLTQSQLEKVLVDTAAKSNCKLSPYLACYLINRCGDGLTVLLSELEKLCCYMQEGEISKEDINNLTVQTMEATAFDLSKAILKREYERSFFILTELFDQRLEPLSILGALNMSFSDLYRAAAAKLEQVPVSTVIQDFHYTGREFRIKNAFRDAASFSIAQIRACMGILSEADLKLKSSRTDDKILLEMAIAKMIAVKEART